jgi:preprotein translocase subunit SecA
VLGIVKKIIGSKNERELKRLWPLTEKIASYEAGLKALDNAQLQAKTPEFRQRIDNGESLDSLLPEAFAVVREAAVRVLGMRHFDVQLIGGMVLHDGKIAEMKTGEGKTLTATLPVYLNALSGKGVHVVTVNDYLAKRDAEWMGQVYRFMGLSTGCVLGGLDHIERQKAYASDIAYGQNNEFGFDFLRDNMKMELEEKSQGLHNYAIVDEVDSILIDESRTPLIISGPSEKPTENYSLADKMVRNLQEGEDKDFSMDLKSKQPTLTESGVHRVEKMLGIDNLYDPQHIEIVHHVNQALKAHNTMHRDTDYVVRNGEIIIVDEFTGRLMAGRRWSDGLHQAVEAKEGVQIRRENQTLATITFQNYFRMYDKLAGMTGTADTEAVEFKQIYGLDVVVIPTNEPLGRQDFPDVVYPTEQGKNRAVVRELQELHETGQPVLVGTASIARSEELSELLIEEGIPHHVLNAKFHEKEAEIVAQAGRVGAITISTNMAGRGTDILLGGNPEFLAADVSGTQDHEAPEYQEALKECIEICRKEKEQVLALGGLHILATERHESRRIDNQLRGRAGRQGDPGSSRFFVSLEDDLMKRFGGERMQGLMAKVGLTEDDALEGMLVARAIENAQRKVEGHHFEQRKQLLEFDDVMNKQREVIYSKREEILLAEQEEDKFPEMIDDVIEQIVLIRADEKVPPSEWDVEGMFREFNRQFGFELVADEFVRMAETTDKGFAQVVFEHFQDKAKKKYEERLQRTGVDNMRHLQRVRHLQAIDYFWKEHLTSMDHLREGIFLRSYGQEKPIHVYQREGFELFNAILFSVKSALIANILIPELPSLEDIRALEEEEKERQREREAAAQAIHQEAGGESGAEERDGKNRKQRRRESRYTASKADYAPSTPVDGGSASSSKKSLTKKKRKKAKKARKKNR